MATNADLIRAAESGGNVYARNERSSAAGPDQFIDGTWLDTLAKHRPDLVQGRTRDDILALRTNPDYAGLSADMTAAYAADNAGLLQRAGIKNTPGTTYLSHFAGPQGAIGLLNADPATPAAAVLGPKVMKANPFLAGMTAADVAAWADRKMGGGSAAPARAAPSAPADRAPFSLAPPAQDAPQPADKAKGWTLPQFELAPMIKALAQQGDQQQQPAPMLLPQRPRLTLQLPPIGRGYTQRG